jgi:hypothetical protein
MTAETARFFHSDDGFAGSLLNALDQPANFPAGQARVFGQLTDLIGHNSKTLALLTGAVK